MTSRDKIRIAESEIKRGVDDYLQYGQNLGYWIFFRLNSGSFIIREEGKRPRRIEGTPPGTPDFEVIQRIQGTQYCRVTFLEIKSTDGKQTPMQIDFENLARGQGNEYYLIRDLGRLVEILPYREILGR